MRSKYIFYKDSLLRHIIMYLWNQIERSDSIFLLFLVISTAFKIYWFTHTTRKYWHSHIEK